MLLADAAVGATCVFQALLRVSSDNWLLVNDGTPEPAIILGISG